MESPNYVSLDGSRRVTKGMRARIKPIAIFPIRLGDASFVKPPLSVTSDAAPPVQSRVIPVPFEDNAARQTPPLEPAAAQDVADNVAVKVERQVDGYPLRFSSTSPVGRRRRCTASLASVSQPPLRAPQPVRLAPAGDIIKRKRGRPRKRPAPPEDDASVLPARPQSSADSAPHPPASPAGPQWQPWIPLRRVDDHGDGTQARSTEAANSRGHSTRQPDVTQPRARVMRSGRVSRPPLRFGLEGDVEDFEDNIKSKR